jgi:hypothetical protein
VDSVWRGGGVINAHVTYEDGDTEDISIKEVGGWVGR